MGPTASGKTALAIELAEALGGELVSVDSALVYRGLDIGSAKPAYPHHLVDICDPSERYSAARFARDAREIIGDIRNRGRRPILVGGTMLYYQALFQGLAAMPPADAAIRADIEREAREYGWPHIHAQLHEVDPESAARIHPNHSQRLLRALEVFRATGTALSTFHRDDDGSGIDEEALAIAIAPGDRAVLHERIARRFHAMLDAGFLEEVRVLRARDDLHRDLPALRAVGYRQLWAHLEGECTLEDASAAGIAATRQLAKRQFTWLRKWPSLRWLLTDPEGRVVEHELCAEEGGRHREPGGRADPADLLLNYLA